MIPSSHMFSLQSQQCSKNVSFDLEPLGEKPNGKQYMSHVQPTLCQPLGTRYVTNTKKCSTYNILKQGH
jgi:hypothetical protein